LQNIERRYIPIQANPRNRTKREIEPKEYRAHFIDFKVFCINQKGIKMTNSKNEKPSRVIPDAAEVEKIIRSHIQYSMVAGTVPIPMLDLAAVGAVQLDMLSKLASLYDVDFNKERGRMVISALVGASAGKLMGRMGASLLKMIPGVGTALGIGSQAVLSGASTYALGRLFEKHFQNGETLLDAELDDARKEFSHWLERGKEVVKNLSQKQEDPAETIRKLKEMNQGGILSDEEFAEAKKKILDKIAG